MCLEHFELLLKNTKTADQFVEILVAKSHLTINSKPSDITRLFEDESSPWAFVPT